MLFGIRVQVMFMRGMTFLEVWEVGSGAPPRIALATSHVTSIYFHTDERETQEPLQEV